MRVAVTVNKGRGVFAERGYRAGELIERVPVLVIPHAQLELVEQTVLSDYYFDWGPQEDGAFVLGYGCLFNHSYTPNAEVRKYPEDSFIEFVAHRDIATGEEITTNYNGLGDSSPVWFEVKS